MVNALSPYGGRKERYTVAFDRDALNAMATVTASTNYREVPDFIRAAVIVMIDLLDATGRKLTVVLRDDATGREWEYSPHEPGRAVPIMAAGTKSSIDNVVTPKFKRRDGEISLGASALSGETPEERNRTQRQGRR